MSRSYGPVLPARAHAVPSIVRYFGKFISAGACGSALNMLLFALLASRLRVHYLAASTAAFELSMLVNYLLNNNWTFKDRRRHFFSFQSLAAYQVVSLGALAINLGLLHVLVGMMGLNALFSNAIAIGSGAIWNFFMNLSWTWRRARGAVADALSGIPASSV